jgi:hypothetical protein
MEQMFSEYLPKETLHQIKDLVAASFMRNINLLSAGFKIGQVGAAGALLGGVYGLARGEGWEGAMKRGSAGARIGLLASIPYSSPALASAMYRGLERVGPTTTAVSSQLPKLVASPLASIISDISSRFGIQPTEEDLKQLKGSRVKAVSQ